MKILLYSGTGDGRKLSSLLSEKGAEVTVCVLTEYGRELQDEGTQVLVGPRTREEKLQLLAQADFCIDATHPYAQHVTESLKRACEESSTPYLRLLRAASAEGGQLSFDTAEQAASWLAKTSGNILLTTGSKELWAFACLDPGRLYPRVLPTHDALAACELMQIPHRNIIAMQGPFLQELNAALIRQFHIRYLVTKDGGPIGGFPEKAGAAEECGAELIVLRRPKETGFSEEEILNIIFKGETP